MPPDADASADDDAGDDAESGDTAEVNAGSGDAADDAESGVAAEDDAESGDTAEEWYENPQPDPPSLGPDPPEVDGPTIETPDSLTGDADPETARIFWRLVVVLDVGLLAVALGPMFVYFHGNWRRGILMFAFGIAVLCYGYVRYRRFRDD